MNRDVQTAADDKDTRQDSQATVLVRLVEATGAELFHSPGADPDGFASVPIDGHRETWRIGAKAFRNWLQRLYWQGTRSAANSQAKQDAIGTLNGKACFDGPEHPVFVRLAKVAGAIWLDLADDQWRAVRIDRNGWTIESTPPVRFIRPRGMLPLPVPQHGGSVEDLRSFINIGSDDDWLLMVSRLIATLRPDRPFAVLAVHGEQGSAKSTLCKMLRALVDPNEADLRSDPRTERDLVIAASNGWMVALENLSKIPTWLSDALCRLSTGGGFGTRELFTNDEEKLFNAKRPVMVNGITELATRPDLLDRSILITLPSIPDGKRRTEVDLWAAFEEAKPRILGALLTAVSTALANIDGVTLDCKPRMADFAEWGCAAEPALNCAPGAFLTAYMANRETANESAIASSIITPPLLTLMDGRDEWDGTATDLLADLEDAADARIVRLKNWPKQPHVLSGELKRIAANLRAMGIDAVWGKSGGQRFISITRTTAQNSVQSVQSVQSVPDRENKRPGVSPERPQASSPAPENPDENGPLDAVDALDAQMHDCSVGVPETHSPDGDWEWI